jgi:hypothetical protein
VNRPAHAYAARRALPNLNQALFVNIAVYLGCAAWHWILFRCCKDDPEGRYGSTLVVGLRTAPLFNG